MYNLIKSAVRSQAIKSLAFPKSSQIVGGKREFTRTLWHMSKNPEIIPAISTKSIIKPSIGCTCGCGKQIHTKVERELVEFLHDEILAEKKAQKVNKIPTDIDGFKIKCDGSEVELTKQTENEKIVISFNVNHTVDTDVADEVQDEGDKQPENIAEMKSKPNFDVEFVRGGKTLSFTCAFITDAPEDGEYDDVFGIEEVTCYEGEWKDKTYAVAGDVLDGDLYNLLMNLLDEKGISNEFVEKLGDFSTIYEHSSYIGLLESISKFTIPK